MTVIRLLGPDDWQVFRDLQLESLLDTPEAARLVYDVAVKRSEAEWSHILTQRPIFVAFVDDKPVGMSGGMLMGIPARPSLVSMWVDPAARGTGVASLLVDAVLDWARAQDFAEIALWVLESNARAESLYRKHGFTRTGNTERMPRDASLLEVEMTRPLP